MSITAAGSPIAVASAPAPRPPKARSLRGLCAVNFFLADVRDGLGPFLGVFLIGNGWSPATIGYVLTLGGIAGMLATTPLGALADATRAKRFMVGLCAVLVVAATLAILFVPSVPVVAASQIGTGIAGAAIGPAVAALTLGLVGQKGLPRQLGRNEAFNHAGNAFAAVGAGLLGYFFGLPAVFALMTVLALASLAAIAIISPRDVDHDVARGLRHDADGGGETPSGLATLWRSTPLLVLAGTLMLFHLGNAALLPLLGQQVASREGGMDPTLYTALTVVIAQGTMIPVALLAARFAERSGYFYVLLAALVALPVRAVLAALWTSSYAVLPVQMLDGVGAGLLGVAVPGLVARILNGTGRVNAGLGAVMTVQGVGAALSPAIAGTVAARFGFPAAYLALGAFAAAGLVLWLVSLRKVARSCAAEPA